MKGVALASIQDELEEVLERDSYSKVWCKLHTRLDSDSQSHPLAV